MTDRRGPTAPLTALLTVLVLAATLALAPLAHAKIEDFADYQPEQKCSPRAKPGAAYVSDWLVRTYGGTRGRIGSTCSDAVSEHQEGRAVDWGNDATRKADRKRVARFLRDVTAEDHRDRPAARARRMGIMYIIWNDRMYAAWDGFEPERYLSSSCKSRKKCSKTLRHRDHVHISFTRRGGFGNTSWFDGRDLDKD